MTTNRVYRPARPGEEDTIAGLIAECFAWTSAGGRRSIDLLELERWRVVEQAGRLVAMTAVIQTGHWVAGGVVPSVAVGLLGTSTESRGGGTARFLITELLREARAAGIPLSTLYPASRTLYRRMGYEAAGMRLWYEARPREFNMTDRTLPIRRLNKADEPIVRALYDRAAAIGSAWMQRPDYKWHARLYPTDHEVFSWLIGTDDDPRGYFVAAFTAEPGNKKLILEDHVVVDAPGARRLLTAITDMGMQLNTARWCGQPSDPLRSLLPEAKVTVAFSNEWFLRVIDVPRALETRRWPRGLNTQFNIAVADDLFPENAGPWQVDIADGHARVTTAPSATVTMDVRALAALFLSHRHPRDLAQVGLLHADDTASDLLGMAFSGPLPSLSDDF